MIRSRASLLVASGIGLTVLLGLVAFASRGHISPAGGGGENRAASQVLANVVFTLWALAMLFGVALLGWVLAQKRLTKDSQPFRLRPLIGTLAFFAFLFISLLIAQSRLGGDQELRGRSPLTAFQQQFKNRNDLKRPHAPAFEWKVAVAIIALIVGISLTALLRARSRRQRLVDEITLAQKLTRMLDETLDDLLAEKDPRKAVIAAYARMERILAAHGLARRPSEAPLEYLSRVLTELHVSEQAVERLTRLFERAKFSTHEIGPEMKDEAIEALISLQDDLRAIDRPDDPPALRLQDVPGSAR